VIFHSESKVDGMIIELYSTTLFKIAVKRICVRTCDINLVLFY